MNEHIAYYYDGGWHTILAQVTKSNIIIKGVKPTWRFTVHSPLNAEEVMAVTDALHKQYGYTIQLVIQTDKKVGDIFEMPTL